MNDFEEQEGQMLNGLSPWSHAINYGLILGAIMVVLTFVTQATGLSNQTWVNYADYILIIGMVILAQRAFKDKGDSFMTFGQGLTVGSVIGVISSTINSIFLYVYMNFIDVSMIEKMREIQVEALMDQGYDQETIDTTLAMLDSVMTPGSVAGISLLTFAFLTFVISLIITAFTKKDNPNIEFN